MRWMMAGAITILVVCFVLSNFARSETIRTQAGAQASVSSRAAPMFRAFIRDLEAHGAVLKFIGGIRAGHCGVASRHPCGMAVDFCQIARGVVDRRCRLPNHRTMSALARKNGLFSGGDWRNDDYGHVELQR